jgi:hypothetical protein
MYAETVEGSTRTARVHRYLQYIKGGYKLLQTLVFTLFYENKKSDVEKRKNKLAWFTWFSWLLGIAS